MASTHEQAARQRSATFAALLDPASLLPGQTVVNLYSLRQLCLQGVPEQPSWLRAQAWKALLLYLPEEKRDWPSTLDARRKEYYRFLHDFLPLSLVPPPPEAGQTLGSEDFSPRDVLLDELYKDLRRSKQNSLAFYHSPVPPSASSPIAPAPEGQPSAPRLACRHNLQTRLQTISHEYRMDQSDAPEQDLRWHSLLRLLYIYALLNPALGYIQGMNEIAFVLLYVFGHASPPRIEIEDDDMEAVLHSADHAEADAFWCFSALLGDIRDLFTFDGLDRVAAGQSSARPPVLGAGVLQSGNMAAALRSFSYRLHWIDLELWKTLRVTNLDPQLPYFSFRWLACLLSTELSLPSVLRVWDMVFAEQGLSDPAVSGCAISAKVDLLIDVCCALLVSIRGTLMDAAVPRPEDADGEFGAFGRLLSLLQDYPEEDLAPVFELALLYRQRRMSAPLTGDHPQHDTDLSLESGASVLRKRAAGLYQAWRPNRTVSASSQLETEGYVQSAAAAGAEALRGYTHAFQSSDTAAQLSKMRTNLTVKAMEGWNHRRPSAPPANATSGATSPSSETGWLGRSRAALNVASESFRSVSGSLASPVAGEVAPPTKEFIPRASSPAPTGAFDEEPVASQGSPEAVQGSPPAERQELHRPEPAKRVMSATELLRAKYIDNAPPRPPPLPKRNLGTPPRPNQAAAGKKPSSPGVRRMASTSSVEVDRSDTGVERVPSSSSKAESIAISVSSYEAPTVAAGRFFNRKRDPSRGSTLPNSTPPTRPHRISAESEEIQDVAEEDKLSSSSASPFFSTPVGSEENLPHLSQISPSATYPQTSSDAPTTTVRTRVKTHGRGLSGQPRETEKSTVRTHSLVEPAGPVLPAKPRQKHVKALSIAEALSRYADDQSSPYSPSSKSSGRELLTSPVSGSGEEVLASPVPDDGRVRYTLIDGPNPTSTVLASSNVSPATSLRRTEVNPEGRRRVASSRTGRVSLSVSEGRAGRTASQSSGKGPPPSSFRSQSPQGATGLLKRTSRVHSRRASQASEIQFPMPGHAARPAPYTQLGSSASFNRGTNEHNEPSGPVEPRGSETGNLSLSTNAAEALYDDPYAADAMDLVQSPLEIGPAAPQPSTRSNLSHRSDRSAPPHEANQGPANKIPSAAEAYEYDPELVSELLRQEDVLAQLDAASLYD